MICFSCGAQLEVKALVCDQCGLPTEHDAEVSQVEGIEVDSLLRVGTRLADRYLVKRSLGVGRLGVTYHVTDLDTGRAFALKTIFRHLLFSKRDRRRFQAWMESARPLSTDRIAAPLRSGRDDRYGSFVVTELIDGVSLARLQATRGHPASLIDTARLVGQLRQALQGLSSTVSHGGLHPGNILVLPDRVVLTDPQSYKGMLPQLWSEAQRQGLGGASWLAPEVVQGREDIDRRADVYSVAAITVWMLTGMLPGEAALDALRARWPAIAGVLCAAYSDLASERIFEVAPLESVLLEEAAKIEGSGESIALAESDLVAVEMPEEVTEVTTSEEYSIRAEDVLGDAEPERRAPAPPDTLDERAEAKTSEPASAPVSDPQPKVKAPLRDRPKQRQPKPQPSLATPTPSRRGMPQWLSLAFLCLFAAGVAYGIAKVALPMVVATPGATVRPAKASLKLEEHVAVPFDAGKAAQAAPVPSPQSTTSNAEALAAIKRALGEGLDAGKAAMSRDVSRPYEDASGVVGRADARPTRPASDGELSPPVETGVGAADKIAKAPVDDPAPQVSAETVPEPEPKPAAAPVPPPRARAPKGKPKCKKGMGLVRGKHTVYCVDRYEYPNYLRSAPIGNFNAFKAKALCEKKGKRICTEKEWTAACMGPAGQAFAYGSRFVAGRCNTVEDGRDEAVAPLDYKKCRSPFRIYAMAGNLAEWTKTPSGYVLKGGSYAHGGSASRCRSTLKRSSRVAQPEFGVRCCANPTYK